MHSKSTYSCLIINSCAFSVGQRRAVKKSMTGALVCYIKVQLSSYGCTCVETARAIHIDSLSVIITNHQLPSAEVNACLNKSAKDRSVVTTIEFSPPPRWLATIEPPPQPRCCTVFSAVFSAPFHDSFHILCCITDRLRLQLPGCSRRCTK